MRATFLVLMASLVAATPAGASGYSALNAGISARLRGDTKLAIQQLTLAIDARDLPPGLLPAARFDRCSVYVTLSRLPDALADCNVAISLRPSWYEALMLRADIHRDMNDDGAALSDASAAIALRPEWTSGYDLLAGIHLHQNNLDAAIADESQAIGFDPSPFARRAARAKLYQLVGHYDLALVDLKAARDGPGKWHAFDYQIGIVQWELGKNRDAADSFDDARSHLSQNLYPMIWKAIAEQASTDAVAELAKRSSSFDLTAWPGPLVLYFLGKRTADEVKATQKDPADPSQKCEVEFYFSEWQLLHHDDTGVRELLQSAVNNCPLDSLELTAAKRELNRVVGAVHAGP